MKAAETKTSSVATNQEAKQSFFNKGDTILHSKESIGHSLFFPGNEQAHHFFRHHNIQTKLTVGQPNDHYEMEADATADKVVGGSGQSNWNGQTMNGITVQSKRINNFSPIVQTRCAACEAEGKLQEKEKDDRDLGKESLRKKPIFESNTEPSDEEKNFQRKCAECEKKDRLQTKSDSFSGNNTSSNIESALIASKGSGSPLPEDKRTQMESSFGVDLSGVRIHNDSSAAQMNKDLNAQAFTHGNDIYFNAGKYDTNSKAGNHLLAHELTHTVQQEGIKGNGQAQPKIQRMPDWLKSATDWVSTTASETVNSAVQGAQWVGGKISQGATAIKETVEEGVTAIFDEIKGLVNSGMDWLNEKWTALQEFASSGFETVKNAFGNIIGFLQSPMSMIANAIMSFDAESLAAAWAKFSAVVTTVWDGFKLLTGNLLDQVNKIWEGISGFANSLLDRVAGITQNFLFKKLPDALQKVVNVLLDQLRSLWRSISEGTQKIINKIKTWVDSALDTILQFVLRVTSFGINVIIEGIRQFGQLILFIQDLFTNPQKYIDILARKSVDALEGVENRFSEIVSRYFGDNKKTDPASHITGTIQKQPNPGAPAEAKTSASWGEIGTGIWSMMGKKWKEFKSNPWSIVTGLLLDLVLPIVGNVKDIIQLFKDIWKIVTGPLSAGSLEEVWTSFLLLLDIPILIYHTVVSILMRSLMLPLIIASFIPHPLVKAIAAAVGYGLLGEFVQVELINIGHKLLLLKTGATTKDQKQEAYNRIADSLIALGMTAAIMLLMLLLHFLGSVVKAIYNFVKGKVFPVEVVPVEGKGGSPGEGKTSPGEGEGKGTKAGETPKLEGEAASRDGQRSIKVTEKGKIWICASPCEEIRLKYEAQIKENPQLNERIKALEEGYSDLSPEEKTVRDGQIKQLEQELADAKLAQEGGVRAPKDVKWPPDPPKGDKPPITSPDAAEWRYQRYVYEKYQANAAPKDVLPPDEWMRRYFDPTAEGGRPGRPGGPEQVEAKKALAAEGIKIVENVEVGGRYPDGVDPKLNPQGGKSFFEVGKMLDNGIPEARERVKIADEIKGMGPNDSVTFVDKGDVAKRVTYTKGSTPENPTSRTFTPGKE